MSDELVGVIAGGLIGISGAVAATILSRRLTGAKERDDRVRTDRLRQLDAVQAWLDWHFQHLERRAQDRPLEGARPSTSGLDIRLLGDANVMAAVLRTTELPGRPIASPVERVLAQVLANEAVNAQRQRALEGKPLRSAPLTRDLDEAIAAQVHAMNDIDGARSDSL
jgi:hypothetical protein